MLAVGADASEGVERFRSLRLVEALLDEFGIPENGRERCPQLMAHVGHELVLVLARDLEVLDGLGKLARARLRFFEEARVLNRNHGLVRKGIDELDLAFAERAHFGALGLEQPRVLDGDYRLVGECLEQLDLLDRKWSWLRASDTDHADGSQRRLCFWQ